MIPPRASERLRTSAEARLDRRGEAEPLEQLTEGVLVAPREKELVGGGRRTRPAAGKIGLAARGDRRKRGPAACRDADRGGEPWLDHRRGGVGMWRSGPGRLPLDEPPPPGRREEAASRRPCEGVRGGGEPAPDDRQGDDRIDRGGGLTEPPGHGSGPFKEPHDIDAGDRCRKERGRGEHPGACLR